VLAVADAIGAAMKMNTALGTTALGLALGLSQLGRLGRVLTHLSFLGAALATAIGGLTLAEYVLGWDLGIDQLLFTDEAGRDEPFPGRPPALTALLLLLLGVGLLCPERKRLWLYVKTSCALVSLLITWTLLNGYLFGRDGPPAALPLGSVAVQVAVAMYLLALGTLASQPDSWPIRTLCADNIGGTICRWLLPPALLAPPLLGWLLTDAALLSEPHAAFRWALYSVFSSAGSVGLILALARRIELVDAERSAATMMSRSDPLTGLANRRAFDGFLAEAFNLARRHGRALALLLIDIDHFKQYNDTYGHPAGDEVLKNVAATFGSVARETDLVARIGGEEFAIVLPETSGAGARALAERIRAQVAALELRRRVTVSIGVASLSNAIPTPAALVKEGDAALYTAKRRGRNQVALSAAALISEVL
jgi:diguanylate cyclase (GGDEF)-like protein